jgi:predicted lactoylglutathione lyase
MAAQPASHIGHRQLDQRKQPHRVKSQAKSREVIVGLSADSREQVDDLAEKALVAGQALGEPGNQGLMYMRGFRDLDGHQWSFIYMDMSAIPEDERMAGGSATGG